jgi:drug/metabolite transporter (DMT)-like permease
MKAFGLLILAAALEIGGDALFRWGLKGGRWAGLALGAILLAGYGLSVNLPGWNFGRLLGVYIAVFFTLSQIVAVAVFRESIPLPSIVGGALILTGGILIAVWRVA